MPFFTFHKLRLIESPPQEFLRLWAPLYREGPVNDRLLKENLRRGQKLDPAGLESLWHWRRQRNLEKEDWAILDRLQRSLERINRFRMKPGVTEEETLDFYEEAADWIPDDLVLRVFILHLARPHQFPLFDEKIYLAHQVITDLPPKKPKPLASDNDAAYFSFMKTFFQMVAAGAKPEDSLYQALSAFGDFLSRYQSVIQF